MKPTQYTRTPRIMRCDTPSGRERYVVRWTEPGRTSRRRYVGTMSEAQAIAASVPRLTNRTPIGALSNRITIDPRTGCWNVSGSVESNGYPRIEVARRKINTHRLMFEAWHGPIPEGLELDHICRNHRCCNPEHLEPVTRRVNVLRGESPIAKSVRTNMCRNGHELTPENTYVKPSTGYRQCRTCLRTYKRARRAAGLDR